MLRFRYAKTNGDNSAACVLFHIKYSFVPEMVGHLDRKHRISLNDIKSSGPLLYFSVIASPHVEVPCS